METKRRPQIAEIRINRHEEWLVSWVLHSNWLIYVWARPIHVANFSWINAFFPENSIYKRSSGLNSQNQIIWRIRKSCPINRSNNPLGRAKKDPNRPDLAKQQLNTQVLIFLIFYCFYLKIFAPNINYTFTARIILKIIKLFILTMPIMAKRGD